jgi:group I intron endonuclease
MNFKYRYVYKTTNLINGKIYVGQHSTNKEFKKDKYIGNGIDNQNKSEYTDNVFCKAVRKYKYENFKCEILEYCQTKKELDIREVFWIKELNSLLPNGYNMVARAGGGYISKEHYERLSREFKNRKNSEEQNKQHSINMTGDKNHRFGRENSKESNEKNRQSHLNKNKIECQHCKKMVDIGNLTYYHGDYCKQNPNRIIRTITCPYCNKSSEGNMGSMKQHHFDNCKYKK